MAYDLSATSAVTYTTTNQVYGTAARDGGVGVVSNILPSNKTFRIRVSVKTTATTTQVAVGKVGAFWVGMLNDKAHAQFGSSTNLSTTININDGNAHHLDLRVSESGAQFYIDGVLAASSATSATAAGVTTSGTLAVGELYTLGYLWNGVIDEVSVSGTIPASGSYTPAATSNSESGLIAVWHLESNLLDSTSTGATVPGAPTIGTATSASGQATTTFTAPASDGGSTITSYTATAYRVSDNVSQGTVSGASSPLTVTGLTNDVAVYLKVKATNAIGTGAESVASNNVTPTASPATAITLTGPSSGNVGIASSNFTAGANGAITGTITVTPSDSSGGGSFTPASVNISSGTPTAAFTYTAGSTGTKSITVTNNGGLTNPTAISYNSTTAPKYTQVNATDANGQDIMVLVPAAGSANPYNSANPARVIIYAHGNGENQQGLIDDALKAGCVDTLIDAGYILAGSNAHGGGWGNQASVDDYAMLGKYLRDNYNVANVAIWSQSMGGHSGLLAIAQGKLRGVVGWLGTYPSCNLAAMYAAGTYTSNINTAFGATSGTYANKTYGNDPALLPATAFRHVPMRFYASAGDTVVSKATGTDVLAALVAGTAREAVVVTCTGDHGHSSHFQPADYLDFFNRCFASPIATQGSLQPLVTTTSRTVTLTLADSNGPLANLTGLKVAFFDEITPDLHTVPRYQNSSQTTNGSGVLSFSVNSTLSSGGVGSISVKAADGRHYNGQVTVT